MKRTTRTRTRAPQPPPESRNVSQILSDLDSQLADTVQRIGVVSTTVDEANAELGELFNVKENLERALRRDPQASGSSPVSRRVASSR